MSDDIATTTAITYVCNAHGGSRPRDIYHIIFIIVIKTRVCVVTTHRVYRIVVIIIIMTIIIIIEYTILCTGRPRGRVEESGEERVSINCGEKARRSSIIRRVIRTYCDFMQIRRTTVQVNGVDVRV